MPLLIPQEPKCAPRSAIVSVCHMHQQSSAELVGKEVKPLVLLKQAAIVPAHQTCSYVTADMRHSVLQEDGQGHAGAKHVQGGLWQALEGQRWN